MKAFPHIISKLLYEPLMITPAKHSAFCKVIDAHLTAGKVMDDDGDDDGDSPDDSDYRQYRDVAIIPVYGVIGKHLEKMASASPGCDLDDLCSMIDIAESDSTVKKIVFDFRTPGGDVVGIPEAARRIFNSPKDTFAFTDSECCSGGVYLATQCQRSYATPSSRVGSIGVWSACLDISRAMANEGENMQAVFAGKYKLMGAYWKPLSDEERGIMQKRVDRLYEGFKSAVNSRRSLTEQDMGNGLIFDGDEAAERGLVDGTVEDLQELLDELT